MSVPLEIETVPFNQFAISFTAIVGIIGLVFANDVTGILIPLYNLKCKKEVKKKFFGKWG